MQEQSLMDEIKERIAHHVKLLPTHQSVSTQDAEERAGKFLEITAHIADMRHVLTDQKIKASSVAVATFSDEMNKSESKQVTEKKAQAEASKAYMTAREDLEYLENDLSYLKTYMDIFNNAHIFYRQIAKGETL